MLLKRVNGDDPADSVLADHLRAAGFSATSRGYHRRVDPEEGSRLLH